jgi:hypothetical protein
MTVEVSEAVEPRPGQDARAMTRARAATKAADEHLESVGTETPPAKS